MIGIVPPSHRWSGRIDILRMYRTTMAAK